MVDLSFANCASAPFAEPRNGLADSDDIRGLASVFPDLVSAARMHFEGQLCSGSGSGCVVCARWR